MRKPKLPLLVRILIAIILGILLGLVIPVEGVRVMITFNGIFNSFLQFIIPLIIIGLVTPAIADIGKGAGKLLLITAALAYVNTVFAGYLSYFTSTGIFPSLITGQEGLDSLESTNEAAPYFTIAIPPMFDVMTSLVFSFILGLGIAFFSSPRLKEIFDEFKAIIVKTIETVILPFLPVYIFGIFLSMTFTGTVYHVLSVFAAIIVVIFALHIFLLLFQYTIVGVIVRRNPLRLLYTMLPAYFTALGTSSSAATIPVTLNQTIKNNVSKGVAEFVIPLCATIHLSGSCLKIVACAVALMLMLGQPVNLHMFTVFILMLAVMMVAAPGVPGGAIMAALGVLSSFLGFGKEEQALMIALYIAMDNFGTACNVTGDGAIAIVVDTIFP